MTQRRSWFAAAATAGVALALMVGAGTAQARSDVYWSVGVGAPGVALGVGNAAPVYYAPPPPVYYAPPPVVYAPPRPVYYAPPPVVYAPQPIGYGYYQRGWGHHHHHHHGHRDWR
ncbi:MAG: hypothetical protein KGM60_14755 [Comamonadaceae bacterium]|nr:hypothetical protein [Pseudomonadota bacterium]MBS0611498.1 hypothetical protein [Pseudomonadota bacterium]MDE2416015.1 hypothetical protein [Comamonadaceae bacterium]